MTEDSLRTDTLSTSPSGWAFWPYNTEGATGNRQAPVVTETSLEPEKWRQFLADKGQIFSSIWQEKLLQTWNVSFEKKYLVKIKQGQSNLYFVQDPSQKNQIVSEGQAYWMLLAAGYARLDPARKNFYQERFDGLLNGTLAMTELARSAGSGGSFPAWVVKVVNGRLELNTDKGGAGARNSASDADLDIVRALIWAQQLVEQGVWADHGYAQKIKELVDAAEDLFDKSTGRYLMGISEDEPGNYRFDYFAPASCLEIAQYCDKHGLGERRIEFWQKAAQDSWAVIKAAFESTGNIPAEGELTVAADQSLSVSEITPQGWDGIRGPWRLGDYYLTRQKDTPDQELAVKFLTMADQTYTVPALDAAAYLPIALAAGDYGVARNLLGQIESSSGLTVYGETRRYYQTTLIALALMTSLFPNQPVNLSSAQVAGVSTIKPSPLDKVSFYSKSVYYAKRKLDQGWSWIGDPSQTNGLSRESTPEFAQANAYAYFYYTLRHDVKINMLAGDVKLNEALFLSLGCLSQVLSYLKLPGQESQALIIRCGQGDSARDKSINPIDELCFLLNEVMNRTTNDRILARTLLGLITLSLYDSQAAAEQLTKVIAYLAEKLVLTYQAAGPNQEIFGKFFGFVPGQTEQNQQLAVNFFNDILGFIKQNKENRNSYLAAINYEDKADRNGALSSLFKGKKDKGELKLSDADARVYNRIQAQLNYVQIWSQTREDRFIKIMFGPQANYQDCLAQAQKIYTEALTELENILTPYLTDPRFGRLLELERIKIKARLAQVSVNQGKYDEALRIAQEVGLPQLYEQAISSEQVLMDDLGPDFREYRIKVLTASYVILVDAWLDAKIIGLDKEGGISHLEGIVQAKKLKGLIDGWSGGSSAGIEKEFTAGLTGPLFDLLTKDMVVGYIGWKIKEKGSGSDAYSQWAEYRSRADQNFYIGKYREAMADARIAADGLGKVYRDHKNGKYTFWVDDINSWPLVHSQIIEAQSEGQIKGYDRLLKIVGWLAYGGTKIADPDLAVMSDFPSTTRELLGIKDEPQKYFLYGEVNRWARNYAEANRGYRQFLGLPENYDFSDLADRFNRTTNDLNYFNRMDVFDAWFGLAQIQMTYGNYATAQQIFLLLEGVKGQIEKMDSEKKRSRLLLANLSLRLGDLALQNMQLARAGGLYQKALNYINGLEVDYKDFNSEDIIQQALVGLAEVAIASGNLGEGFSQLCFVRGQLVELEQSDSKNFSLSQKGRLVDVTKKLAGVCEKMGQYQEALTYYDQVITSLSQADYNYNGSKEAEIIAARANQAKIYLTIGREDETSKTLKLIAEPPLEASDFDLTVARANYYCVKAQLAFRRGEISQAIAAYQNALMIHAANLTKNPDFAESINLMKFWTQKQVSDCYLALGRVSGQDQAQAGYYVDQAQQTLDQIKQCLPYNETEGQGWNKQFAGLALKAQRAQAARQQYRYDEALAIYQELDKDYQAIYASNLARDNKKLSSKISLEYAGLLMAEAEIYRLKNNFRLFAALTSQALGLYEEVLSDYSYNSEAYSGWVEAQTRLESYGAVDLAAGKIEVGETESIPPYQPDQMTSQTLDRVRLLREQIQGVKLEGAGLDEEPKSGAPDIEVSFIEGQRELAQARIWQRARHFKEAVVHYDNYLKAYPQDNDALLARAEARMGEEENFFLDFGLIKAKERQVFTDDDPAWDLSLEDVAQVIGRLGEADQPDLSAKVLGTLARYFYLKEEYVLLRLTAEYILLKQGSFEAIESQLDKLIAGKKISDQAGADLKTILGWLKDRAGQFAAKDQLTAHNWMARIYQQIDQNTVPLTGLIEGQLNQVLEIDPQNIGARLSLAEVYCRRSEQAATKDTAQDWQAKAIEQVKLVQPDYTQAPPDLLNYALQEIGLLNWAKAYRREIGVEIKLTSKLKNFIEDNDEKYIYDEAEDRLLVIGRMSEQDRQALLASCDKQEDKDAIDRLYKQSQNIDDGQAILEHLQQVLAAARDGVKRAEDKEPYLRVIYRALIAWSQIYSGQGWLAEDRDEGEGEDYFAKSQDILENVLAALTKGEEISLPGWLEDDPQLAIMADVLANNFAVYFDQGRQPVSAAFLDAAEVTAEFELAKACQGEGKYGKAEDQYEAAIKKLQPHLSAIPPSDQSLISPPGQDLFLLVKAKEGLARNHYMDKDYNAAGDVLASVINGDPATVALLKRLPGGYSSQGQAEDDNNYWIDLKRLLAEVRAVQKLPQTSSNILAEILGLGGSKVSDITSAEAINWDNLQELYIFAMSLSINGNWVKAKVIYRAIQKFLQDQLDGAPGAPVPPAEVTLETIRALLKRIDKILAEDRRLNLAINSSNTSMSRETPTSFDALRDGSQTFEGTTNQAHYDIGINPRLFETNVLGMNLAMYGNVTAQVNTETFNKYRTLADARYYNAVLYNPRSVNPVSDPALLAICFEKATAYGSALTVGGSANLYWNTDVSLGLGYSQTKWQYSYSPFGQPHFFSSADEWSLSLNWRPDGLFYLGGPPDLLDIGVEVKKAEVKAAAPTGPDSYNPASDEYYVLNRDRETMERTGRYKGYDNWHFLAKPKYLSLNLASPSLNAWTDQHLQFGLKSGYFTSDYYYLLSSGGYMYYPAKNYTKYFLEPSLTININTGRLEYLSLSATARGTTTEPPDWRMVAQYHGHHWSLEAKYGRNAGRNTLGLGFRWDFNVGGQE